MTTINRSILALLLAGLLVSSSLVFGLEVPDDGGELSLLVHDGLVSLTAENVSAQEVIEAIANEVGLRLVQQNSLDRIITLKVEAQPLHQLLGHLLRNDSYQLYLVTSNDNVQVDNPIPSTLWIFPQESDLAPVATVFFEAVLYRGSLREKQEAIRELQRLGTPTAVRSLSLGLTDENERVRDQALEALENIGTDEALGAIASAAMDSDPWVRSEAVTALASGDTDTAAQYLSAALDDPDPRVRISVVEALADVPWGTRPSEHAVAALNRALKDQNPAVRMQAVDSLELIGGDIAFQALMQAKRDQDADIADAARESLNSMNSSR